MFNLSRRYFLLSLLLVLFAAGLLGGLYRYLALQETTALAEGRNLAVAQMFRNSLGPGFGDFLARLPATAPGAPRNGPEGRSLHASVSAMLRDTAVVRVKVYNRRGVTVFSTDSRQIGDDLAASPGVRAALAGTVASELVHRSRFEGLAGNASDVDLLATYVPIARRGAGVDGALELYQDVTPWVAQVDRRQGWVTGAIAGLFACCYLLQFPVVRRAHRILQEQETRIAAAKATLELQVEQRTAELIHANRQLLAAAQEGRPADGQLHFLAYHDPLTGLANRRCFVERLERSTEWARRKGLRLALLFIDLDQFKQVTDSLGHSVGDALLVAVAERLAGQVRAIDLLARLGGDEFICLLEGAGNEAEVARLAKALIASIDAPFQAAGQELFLSASVGISLFPGDGSDVEALLRNADTAMFRAKRLGRGQYHFYTPEMTRDAQERIRTENLLHRAIERGELAVVFQQQVESGSGALTGAEALTRWISPELGDVSPERFIALAEESGLIVPLGTWALRESCRQLAAWRDAGFDLPQVSVNISVRQLERPDFVDTLTAILAETGIEACRLKLEITESVVMAVEGAIAPLERLRALGIGLAIDDFGTGYSSLSYLRKLPVQQLKIDRAFVVGIGRDPGDEAIVRTILALARNLGIDVVAEGVETRKQATFLDAAGCRHLQGYLHGMPAPAAEFQARWCSRELLEA